MRAWRTVWAPRQMARAALQARPRRALRRGVLSGGAWLDNGVVAGSIVLALILGAATLRRRTA
jgi:hypothetical protein